MSGLGKFLVHLRPFLVLARRGGDQVLRRAADDAKQFEPHFRVFFFVVRCFGENHSNLLVALFFRGGRKICVFVARLGFAREHICQISLRTAAIKFHRDHSPEFLLGTNSS